MKYYKSVIILFVFWVFSACGDTSSSSDDDDLLPPTQGLVSSIEDARDNHVYSTTQIGTQVWLAENLQYKTTHSWCYDNVDSNCVIYGRLYGEGTDNLCPEEFHIPSQEEWQEPLRPLGGDITLLLSFEGMVQKGLVVSPNWLSCFFWPYYDEPDC